MEAMKVQGAGSGRAGSARSRVGAVITAAFGVAIGAAVVCVAGCGQAGNGGAAAGSASSNGTGNPPSAVARSEAERKVDDGMGKASYRIGFVAKSIDNPVYDAARAGAEAAAAEFGGSMGVDVEIEWRGPIVESARAQVAEVAALLTAEVDGLAVTASDPTVVVAALDRAAGTGVKVVTFDSDVETPSRLAFYGIDDRAAGAAVMEQLILAMPGGGRVAILAGNRAATNLRERVIGAAAAARGVESVEIVEVYHHDETPEAAGEAMAAAHASGAEIDGWALMGGWPLYTDAGLAGVPDGTKIASMDPLPPALDKLKAGRVQALVAQPYYRWGYESVRMLLERLHSGMLPESEFVRADLEVVTQDNAASYRERWNGWVGTSD
ncbi:MAG: substrate-binding domain-containing protein [Planctomycetota bacterium]